MSYPNTAPLPAEFRMAAGGFRRMLVPFIAMLVFFFVVMLLLGSALTESTGGGIAVGAGATAVMTGVMFLKFRRMAAGSYLRFSAQGVQLVDAKGLHVFLAWPDVVQIGPVQTQMANPKQVGADGGVQVTVGALQSTGLIGWGHRTIPPRLPAWLLQNLEAQPRNPVDGRPLVALPLSQFDPQWQHGAMAEWVRRFRPDLLGGQK